MEQKSQIDKLPKSEILSLEVVSASEKLQKNYKVGDTIVSKGIELVSKDGQGTWGRQKKDTEPHFIAINGDNTVSSDLGTVYYKHNQFALKCKGKGQGVGFLLAAGQKYQILNDCLIKFDNSTNLLKFGYMNPQEQVEFQDQKVFSTQYLGLDDVTMKQSNYKVEDQNKPQILVNQVDLNLKEIDQTQKQLVGTDKLKSISFKIGSDEGCDYVIKDIAPHAATLTYDAGISAWTIETTSKNLLEQRIIFCFLKHDNWAKEKDSEPYRLANGQYICLGKGFQNVFKVALQ